MLEELLKHLLKSHHQELLTTELWSVQLGRFVGGLERFVGDVACGARLGVQHIALLRRRLNIKCIAIDVLRSNYIVHGFGFGCVKNMLILVDSLN